MKDVMWTEKYRPKSICEIIGNEEAKVAIVKWLKNWVPGNEGFLLWGPPGTGKTSLVQAAAHDFQYQLIEMNASDVRTEKQISRVLGPASIEGSLDKAFYGYSGLLLFVDEIDGIFGREDHGGMAAIQKILEVTRVPIILAANSTQREALQPLIHCCQIVRFQRVRPPVLLALLKNICRLEGIDAEEGALEMIAEMSQGDVRSSINDLQSASSGAVTLRRENIAGLFARDRPANISETLNSIFAAQTLREAKKAIDESDMDYESIYQALHDNLPFRFRDPEALATAYDYLSKADICFGEIKKTQDWHLLSYALELMVSGIVLAKDSAKENNHFPNSRFVMLGRSRATRSLLDELAQKIGFRYHVSKRTATEDYLNVVKVIMLNHPEQKSKISEQLSFSDEARSYLEG